MVETPVRLKPEIMNFFLSQGSTKCPEDCIRAIWRIREIFGGTEERGPPPTLLVEDEETYRFLCDFRRLDLQRKSLRREYPGDWHILLHGGRVVSNRGWVASIEMVAEKLGTDDKK